MSLRTAVAAFRRWADSLPPDAADTEWERSYERWHELYAEAEAFISQSDYEDWSPGDKQDLLYALARDNEDEILADALRRRPELLVAVAEDALACGDSNARWQIAAMLGELTPLTAEIETLLVRFAVDDDEYVRRRALLALAAIGSGKTEQYALAAWTTGEISARAAALAALHLARSALLSRHLDLAFEDGRTPLVTAALRVMAQP
jgi:hypothetical protein